MEEQIKPCSYCRAFVSGSCKAQGCQYKESETCPCVGCLYLQELRQEVFAYVSIIAKCVRMMRAFAKVTLKNKKPLEILPECVYTEL